MSEEKQAPPSVAQQLWETLLLPEHERMRQARQLVHLAYAPLKPTDSAEQH